MNFTLTYNKLLNFPNEFLEESAKYYEGSELLGKEECDKYNTKELKDKVEARFKKFKDARYIYKYPNEQYYKSMTPTLNYQAREVLVSRNLTSPQEKMITAMGDTQIWVEKFYYSLMEIITTKMTEEEAVYLVECFFKNKSEDIIAEKLSMCKATLQKVKKSCLIKVWIEMEVLEEDENK